MQQSCKLDIRQLFGKLETDSGSIIQFRQDEAYKLMMQKGIPFKMEGTKECAGQGDVPAYQT